MAAFSAAEAQLPAAVTPQSGTLGTLGTFVNQSQAARAGAGITWTGTSKLGGAALSLLTDSQASSSPLCPVLDGQQRMDNAKGAGDAGCCYAHM